MGNGLFGKILWVDLSNENFKEEELSEDLYRKYLGGYGLAVNLLYRNMPAKINALSSEAILGFFPGLLTGTVAPMTGRFMVVGKSPLTGTWGDANCGGYFGPEIKKCGYDAILVRGTAKGPKYIFIADDSKQILDASELWGLDTVETEEKFNEKHGSVQVACIGQAGEKLSLISGIVTDKARIAARSGLGAVMGSKKLKALVLKGTKQIPLANKDELVNVTKQYNEGITNSKSGLVGLFKTLGTTALNAIAGQTGDAPIKNWGGISSEDFPMERLKKIDGTEILKYKQKDYGCFSCPVHCGAIMKVPEVGLEETHRPEYETCAVFGHMLLNDDLLSIFTINDICNRAGIDVISAGTTVAFAIECFEKGLISKDDTGGLGLSWGDSEAIIKLVKMMINREGFGDLLADGSKRAAEKIGKDSEKYAITSMGQELGMHDAKYYQSLGMSFAFDPTPGRHTTPSLDFIMGPLSKPNGFLEGFSLPRYKKMGDDRFEAHKLVTCLKQTTISLGLCDFAYLMQKYPIIELIKSVVGWDVSVDEIIKIGLRIQTLRQAFTLREGVEIARNKLPGRAIGDPPFESGPHKGKTIDYVSEYRGYCDKMGWNPENGYPLEGTLRDLDLEFVIKDLY